MDSPETQRLLGEANGKLDTVLELLRDHIAQDNKRFEDVFKEIKAHAADINQAKGAKTAILLLAGTTAAAISAVVAAAGKWITH